MSRICLVALALCVASFATAAEPEQVQQDYVAPQYNFQPVDHFAAPQPSGLRFSGTGVQVQTGSVSGGPVSGMGGGGNRCGCGAGGGFSCVDWLYLPWYGSWGGHGGCGRRQANCGCNNCYTTGFGYGY